MKLIFFKMKDQKFWYAQVKLKEWPLVINETEQIIFQRIYKISYFFRRNHIFPGVDRPTS